jgi:uncharacterized protein
MPTELFLLLLFIVAFLYGSVGHGGASGYLAVMGLFHFAPVQMRSTALVMNIIVSFIAAIQYYGHTDFKRRLFFLLICGSIPAAFIGSTISIEAETYRRILGVIILVPAIRLIAFNPVQETIQKEAPLLLSVLMGIIIGFLSGLIGIGGGILLSPLLIFFGWASVKETALISALFIFLNSLAGLAGMATLSINMNPDVYLWIAVVIAGGIAGSWLGSRKFPNVILKRILGIVMLIAGIKLIVQ